MQIEEKIVTSIRIYINFCKMICFLYLSAVNLYYIFDLDIYIHVHPESISSKFQPNNRCSDRILVNADGRIF